MATKPPSFSKFLMALLVFSSCNFLLLFNKRSRREEPAVTEAALEPTSFIASRLSAIAMAYVSYMVYHGIHPSMENLLKGLQKSWKQTAVTMLYIELVNTAAASLLLMLASVGRSAKGAASEAAVIAGAVCLISWLWPLLFVHSDAACKVSLIVSMSEEGCKGEKALERAGELVNEKKAVGFSLMALTVVVDKAMNMMWRFGSAVNLVQLLAMFFTYFLYTSFYYHCKKKGSLKEDKIL